MLRKFLSTFVLWYLRFFAKLRLAIERPKVIGIAGSSGKTSLSLLLGLTLSQKFKVKQSQGQNSETGIPLSILGLKISDYSYFSWAVLMLKAPIKVLISPTSDIFIAEMGIDSPIWPKNMEYLLSIINPDVVAITNITYEHAVYFEKFVEGDKDRENQILALIASEELKLLKSLGPNKLAVVNIDNSFIKKSLPLSSQAVTISSRNREADFFIKEILVSFYGFEVKFNYEEKPFLLKIKQPLPEHFAYTFIEVIAVSLRFGVSIESSINSIQDNFKLPPGRASVFKGIKNSLIIDSTYNNIASEPLIGFLEMIKTVAGNRRKVGIIGDMREQGEVAKLEHEKVAFEIMKNLDFVILIGESMKKYVVPVLKSKDFRYLSFSNFTQARDDISKSIKEEDVILVKSSQNQLFLERAVELLLQDFKDTEKLCRRGDYWDKIRSETL